MIAILKLLIHRSRDFLKFTIFGSNAPLCFLTNSMYGLCEGHATMRKEGLLFVQTVQELLQHLLEYRTIIHDENKENRMSCTVNLLVRLHNSTSTQHEY